MALGEADILLRYFSVFEDVENLAVSNIQKDQVLSTARNVKIEPFPHIPSPSPDLWRPAYCPSCSMLSLLALLHGRAAYPASSFSPTNIRHGLAYLIYES